MIEVKNLTKKFKSFVAVDGISFNVKKGEVFAFLGPNGAGKSTTIKMLTTLLVPDGGSIILNGENPAKNPFKVRSSFGIVFQDPSLDEQLTAWENMDFHGVLYDLPKVIRREKIETLLKFVGLWERQKSLVKEFSGGMKRRLEIARGLMHEPKVLFLDEPTLGLDAQTRNNIWDYLKILNKEKQTTIFLTTHHMEEAEKMADRIAIIDNGKLIVIGTLDELKKSTNTNSLEEVFLHFTGRQIREESAGVNEIHRIMQRQKNN